MRSSLRFVLTVIQRVVHLLHTVTPISRHTDNSSLFRERYPNQAIRCKTSKKFIHLVSFKSI